jgi:rhodanese-related sulfurtransferase
LGELVLIAEAAAIVSHKSLQSLTIFVADLKRYCYISDTSKLCGKSMSNFFGMFPTPSPLQAQSRVYDLKTRLDWGEPALTIIDVRDRSQFSERHILGAVSMPMDQVVSLALSTLALNRDLYVYGETDEETAEVASHLREAGFMNVSELRGGLPAWKAVGYPVESLNATAA